MTDVCDAERRREVGVRIFIDVDDGCAGGGLPHDRIVRGEVGYATRFVATDDFE